MRFLILSLSVCMLFVGCAGKARLENVAPTEGVVYIRYQVQEGDIANPPKGYNVYRSVSESGPFTRVNLDPIPLPADLAVGQFVLLWEDLGLPYGERRYYYIEAVDSVGNRQKITNIAGADVVVPIMNAKAASSNSRPGR